MISTTGIALTPRETITGCCTKLRRQDDGRQRACRVKAKWLVGLRLRPDRHSEPYDYFFDKLRVCNACRRQLQLAEVLTDHTFAHVTKRLLSWNHQPPRRRLTTLVFQHLEHGYTSEG